MELFFFLMVGLAALVLAAVFRRANSPGGARASPAIRTILVGDRSIARSMLVDHARTFSNKPVSPFPVEFVTGERANLSHSINTVPHGALWRALRCNLTAGIFHPSRLDLLAPLQREAIDGLIASLRRLSSASGSGSGDVVVVIRDRLHTAMVALLMRMCFGDGGADARDVRAVQRVFMDFADGMVHGSMLASSRTARLLHWRRWRLFLSVRDRLGKLLLPLIAERQRRRRSGDGCGNNNGIRPFVDSLLDLQVPAGDHDDGSLKRALTDDEKVTLVWEFLDAGTETVVTCVEWTLAHLVDQPEVQEKLRREVDGGDRRDVDTPYLRAVILESLRLHPPVPVIQRDVVVSRGGADDAAAVIGVHVPAEPEADDDSNSTVVRFTIVPGAIGRDSRAWTDPDDFRPERFLAGGEGESVGPTPGPRGMMRMLPFGAGTRQCPGKGIGMMHVRLLLAALVRAFQWGLPAAGAPPVDLTELDGFVKHMKTPLKARITPRPHLAS